MSSAGGRYPKSLGETRRGHADPSLPSDSRAERNHRSSPPKPTEAHPEAKVEAKVEARGEAAGARERPSEPKRLAASQPPPAGGDVRSRGIEIEYVRETQMERVRDPFLEIWTRNHVYLVDDDWTCVGVLEPTTRKLEAKHHFLGSKLSGGQRVSKTSGSVEVVYPVPVPGTEAVFRYPNQRGAQGHYGLTSKVVRVLLRVRKFRGTVSPHARGEETSGLFQLR